MLVDDKRQGDEQRRGQTPVCSEHGEGEVTSKMWNGGKGRLIRIRQRALATIAL